MITGLLGSISGAALEKVRQRPIVSVSLFLFAYKIAFRPAWSSPIPHPLASPPLPKTDAPAAPLGVFTQCAAK